MHYAMHQPTMQVRNDVLQGREPGLPRPKPGEPDGSERGTAGIGLALPRLHEPLRRRNLALAWPTTERASWPILSVACESIGSSCLNSQFSGMLLKGG
jgi:hypothetical protein